MLTKYPYSIKNLNINRELCEHFWSHIDDPMAYMSLITRHPGAMQVTYNMPAMGIPIMNDKRLKCHKLDGELYFRIAQCAAIAGLSIQGFVTFCLTARLRGAYLETIHLEGERLDVRKSESPE